MLGRRSTPAPQRALEGSAHDLQRAAGDVQAHSGKPQAMTSVVVTVAHVEEALDRLSNAMQQLADGAAGPPETVDGLRMDLQSAGEALEASRDACARSRAWAHRIREEHAR